MTICIRPATTADLPGILDLYNQIILNTTATYDLEPVTLQEREEWFSSRTLAGFPVLVATAQDSPAVLGFSSFADWRGHKRGYRYTVEHTVHVHEQARGRGVGTNLLEALFPYAKERNVHAMLGGIDAQNVASLRFHARLGFVEVARFPEVGRKFGRWLDVVFMQKFMDSPGAPRPMEP